MRGEEIDDTRVPLIQKKGDDTTEKYEGCGPNWLTKGAIYRRVAPSRPARRRKRRQPSRILPWRRPTPRSGRVTGY